MAKFQPASISTDEVNVTDEGMRVSMTLPSKTFSTGKNGFFKQGLLTLPDGRKYRINFQAYEHLDKNKSQ